MVRLTTFAPITFLSLLTLTLTLAAPAPPNPGPPTSQSDSITTNGHHSSWTPSDSAQLRTDWDRVMDWLDTKYSIYKHDSPQQQAEIDEYEEWQEQRKLARKVEGRIPFEEQRQDHDWAEGRQVWPTRRNGLSFKQGTAPPWVDEQDTGSSHTHGELDTGFSGGQSNDQVHEQSRADNELAVSDPQISEPLQPRRQHARTQQRPLLLREREG
ncbi:hypothetical protein BJ508DRAFT_311224 [Ascobolus immersus RN42]|uniref:Uncharacterized protein n=1 Tax=Ascobolus immersus RN42 TaxID=1160509 RepID=A0A3N4HWT0_ASCIM|nr:hypothetical protein BJ508DRAFT_311224 [Ascobolus immersus RN42]